MQVGGIVYGDGDKGCRQSRFPGFCVQAQNVGVLLADVHGNISKQADPVQGRNLKLDRERFG